MTRAAVHPAIHLPHPAKQPGIMDKSRAQARDIIGKRHPQHGTGKAAIEVQLDGEIEHKNGLVATERLPDKEQTAKLLHQAGTLAHHGQGDMLSAQLILKPLAEVILWGQTHHFVALVLQLTDGAFTEVVEIP